MNTKKNQKAEIIKAELIAAGLTDAEALRIANTCMTIAYRKTQSTKSMSFDAYKARFGDTRKFEVYEYFKNQTTPRTRQEATDDLGWRKSSITARVHELKTDGYLVVVGTKIDPETQMTVESLVAI